MKWKLSGIIILCFCLCFITACNKGNSNPTTELKKDPTTDSITVIATIFPLYDFAKNIAGDQTNTQVTCLLPAGAEPHHWEPSPKDIVEISKADIFIYTGSNLETWADDVLKTIDAPNLVVINAGSNISLLQSQTVDEHIGHEEVATTVDPHIWLDPLNSKQMVHNILQGFLTANAQQATAYQNNEALYQKKLDALHQDYQESLSKAKQKSFVTSHAAFGYLVKQYGLEQISIRGLSAESEPTPAKMAEIVDYIKKHHIHYIFFESLASPKVSETIAKETGAEILMLHTLEGITQEELNQNKDYLSLMQENLTNLKIALEIKAS